MESNPKANTVWSFRHSTAPIFINHNRLISITPLAYQVFDENYMPTRKKYQSIRRQSNTISSKWFNILLPSYVWNIYCHRDCLYDLASCYRIFIENSIMMHRTLKDVLDIVSILRTIPVATRLYISISIIFDMEPVATMANDNIINMNKHSQ